MLRRIFSVEAMFALFFTSLTPVIFWCILRHIALCQQVRAGLDISALIICAIGLATSIRELINPSK